MILQLLVKINDNPDLTLAGMKDIISNTWQPQASRIIQDNPYTAEEFASAQAAFDRRERYKFCCNILSKPSLQEKLTPVQVAKLIEDKEQYEADPVPDIYYNTAVKILEVKRHVDWANGVNDEWLAKTDSELNNHIDEKNGSKWKDGDIIEAFSPARCKKVWDEMLVNGSVSEAEHAASILADGTHRWPFGSEEKRVHQGFVIEDDFSDAEIDGYSKSINVQDGVDDKDRPIMKMVKRRKFHAPPDQVTYYSNTSKSRVNFSSETLAKIRDPRITVAPRYDKPIQKIEVVEKA